MKTFEDYKKFVDELEKLSKKYEIGIVGTCDSESIYGEITLFDINRPEVSSQWVHPEKQMDFKIKGDENNYYI